MSQETVDAIFNTFGVEATYTSPLGASTTVSVIIDTSDGELIYGTGKLTARRSQIEVRVTELAQIEKGGTFSSDEWDIDYKVNSIPEKRDPDRLVWTADCGMVL